MNLKSMIFFLIPINFLSLDDNIRRNFSSIILTTMMCLYKIYEEEKRRRLVNYDSAWNSREGPEQSMSELHECAKNVVTYVGLNQFHMPGDTYAQLVKLEVQMT